MPPAPVRKSEESQPFTTMRLLLIFFIFLQSGLTAKAENPPPLQAGTLYLLSFGTGAPLPGPPPDDLYGRDAAFMVEAFKRKPSVWASVDAKLVSGLECTSKRLRRELTRLKKMTTTQDFVIIHASTHGWTEKGLLTLGGEEEGVIDANALAACLSSLPCPSMVSIDACQAGGALHTPLPPNSAWLLGCTEKQSTDGQYDNQAVPHGFQVLALCEALRGDADTNYDNIISIGELFAWTPPRATKLARHTCQQNSIIVLPQALAELPLTWVAPGIKQPLWTMKKGKEISK